MAQARSSMTLQTPVFRRRIRREVKALLSGMIRLAKAKVGDGIDLRSAWLHGWAAERDWRRSQ
jgi:hypothetical protein